MMVSRAALTLAFAILAGVIAFTLTEACERQAATDRFWSWGSIG